MLKRILILSLLAGMALDLSVPAWAASVVQERQTAVKLYRGTTVIAASDPSSSVYVANFTPEACELLREAQWQKDAANRTSGLATYKCQVETRAIIAFRPAAPGALLSWTPPTENTDGSALVNLAGYRISYGSSATALTRTIQVADPKISSYAVSGLSPGTYYFAVRAYTSTGTESVNSNVISKVVP